ncbi:ATP-binding protein [Methylibium petroleiphilum]|uniref:histidine kinase n=1 Tax=Methylibium petroleiphilum (strain ATCC BAA-1232 / LMG 22953 / PM1) TaxID=420662 RepID=A2SMR2_METPP|nr:ATP-binding protein [Methylibium petroleiphilum]ABM96851.1 putative sensor/response hybrid [Methylibium petroleiphilum PM1]
MKSRFLATMSHEIRTPLNGVVGAAELLQKNGLSEREKAQMVSLLTQSSRALMALINDILDWSKLDVGKVMIERHPINLRALVFESNELFAAQAANKDIELTSSCNPDVPRTLHGDPTRIRQIVNNLVSNAVKFTERGGVHIHLSIDGIDPSERHQEGDPRTVRIEVSDTGIGISPEKLGKLFKAFSQGDVSVTRNFGGTGLGLVISQELANLMGGRIEVSSTPGVGSVFTALLPMIATDQVASTGVPRARPDIILAATNVGLRRHIRSLLSDLRIDPTTVGHIPDESELSECRLLLVDAPMLAGITNLSACLDRHSAAGRRVAVLTPLNCDAVVGVLPEAVLLYKPVRLTSIRALVDAVDGVSTSTGEQRTGSDGAQSTPPLRGLRVLIAEDNQVNQVVFQAMLAQAEADCSIARNGQEALDALAEHKFDVVLMDVQMPVLDGISAVRELRARESSNPGSGRTTVVAMTANTEPQDIAQCRSAGMDDFLPKPFSIGQLTSVLARHAHRSPAAAGQALATGAAASTLK